MTRDEAIVIAKQAAWDADPRPSYVPIIPSAAEWDAWMPHDWVVDAVMQAAAPAEPDNGITVSLLELLSNTSMRLGIATPESIETFGATLPRRLYALCRGVNSLMDKLPKLEA